MYDVAVIGAGMAGMAAAARLQCRGLCTAVFEAHGQVGGCAGFFRRQGFAFDVGATTLVDFEPGGVGGELLDSIGMNPVPGERLPGYLAWPPDRTVVLYRDAAAWSTERLRALGDSRQHRRLWQLLDRLAAVFWRASRAGIKLPVQSIPDLWRALCCLGLSGLPLIRYVSWTMGDALRHCGLREQAPLVSLLGMLLEDTVHATVDQAPLINGALGITIRGAGLTRARGGMYGFWRRFAGHYRQQGGMLRVGCAVQRVDRTRDGFRLRTRRGDFLCRQVISAVPAALTSRLAPSAVARALQRYLRRDAGAQGGAVVVFLGVPEDEVGGQHFTHHQLLYDYQRPLGNGNNMFISVSASGDNECAPPGYRSVMISTHCDLEQWEGIGPAEYAERKAMIGGRLLELARRVYPELGGQALVHEVGTPRTYEHFTGRPRGAVGGIRQSLANSNQYAVPHDIGVPGFWLAGDTTWPGLGTVACVLGSRLVANMVVTVHRRGRSPEARPVTEKVCQDEDEKTSDSRAAVPHNGAPAGRETIPRLDDLGGDLLVTTRKQRWLACARPVLGIVLFVSASLLGWWWLTPVLVFLIFVAVVTVTHDVVHGGLGMSPRQTDWALFFFGAILLESGHAYRITHVQHHRVFPGPDDPEGEPARMSLWGAILFGPLFLPRLWWWAYQHSAGQKATRRWLVLEAAWAILVPLAGLLLLPWTSLVLVYALLVLCGSWVYPLLTVHLPHHHYGDSPLTQTSSLRGHIIPALFLELTFHLEHHLYPGVPSHHLPELGRRLEPFFREQGVKLRRVP